MSSNVKFKAEFRADAGQLRSTDALKAWISGLPNHAVLSSISIDKGDQREPWPVLVGLRATWEEER